MQVREIGFDEFFDLKHMWEEALERSLDNNIFQTWEWLTAWWKHYGGKRRFSLITVFEGDKILAAAPLMYTNYKVLGFQLRRIECLTNPAADYHTFLITEKRPELVKLILDYVENEISDWDLIELSDIPQNSETAKELLSFRPNSNFRLRLQDPCPYATLPLDFDNYYKSLSQNLRRNLVKNERRLRKLHKLQFSVYREVSDIKKMAVIFDLHQKRWESKNEIGAFADQKFRDFHIEVASSFAQRGWLALNILTLDDIPVSAGYAFAYRNKLFNYLSGFDPEFSRYRVGSIRLFYLIKNCIHDGLTEIDFMRGAEPYKEQWSTGTRNNLEYWKARKRFIPTFYGKATKNDHLLRLVRLIGKKQVLRQKA